MTDLALFKIYTYDKHGAVADLKVLRISESGAISLEEVIGLPKREAVSKAKMEEQKI